MATRSGSVRDTPTRASGRRAEPGPWRLPSPLGRIGAGLALMAGLLGFALAMNVAGPVVQAGATTTTGSGYDLVTQGGTIFSFGHGTFRGSMGGTPLNQPVVGMASTPSGDGYWEVARDGGIFSFGDAAFHGSMGGKPLNRPIVGMAADPATGGYWEVASDGGVFAFTAPFLGSMGGTPLNAPIVGMAAEPNGTGYWLVAADGGIFAFGSAPFSGSMGGTPLNQPVVGMASTPSGGGYWEVARDGGIFSFGDAAFHGSMGGKPLNQPVVGMAADPATGGYWEVASDGGIFAFTAPFFGSTGGWGTPTWNGVVGIDAVTTTAPTPNAGQGYASAKAKWVSTTTELAYQMSGTLDQAGQDLESAKTSPTVNAATYTAAIEDLKSQALLPDTTPTSADLVRGQANDVALDTFFQTPGLHKPVPLVTDCGRAPAYEPTSLSWCTSTCSSYMTNIAWSTWGTSSATGTGTYVTKTQTPRTPTTPNAVKEATGKEFLPCGQSIPVHHPGTPAVVSDPQYVTVCPTGGAPIRVLAFTKASWWTRSTYALGGHFSSCPAGA